MTLDIPGYPPAPTRSRVRRCLAEFELMKASALFGEDDVKYLRLRTTS